MTEGKSLKYDPSCFNVTNLQQAKNIILTAEGGHTSDERWRRETPYLVELMEKLDIKPNQRVLDYGCGVGRLSKALIGKYACNVIGVDQSVSMRALAAAYVENPKFACFPPGPLLADALLPCHHAICVWVLQHIPALEEAIAEVDECLAEDGSLFVVESVQRFLPTSSGVWVSDPQVVREALRFRFREVAAGHLDAERTTPATAEHAYWAIYTKR